jgi:hypothetical protein
MYFYIFATKNICILSQNEKFLLHQINYGKEYDLKNMITKSILLNIISNLKIDYYYHN